MSAAPTSLTAPTARDLDRRGRFDWPLFALLAVFLVLSAGWALRIPILVGDLHGEWSNFNPDERSHIRVTEYLAAHRALPPYRSPYEVSLHPPFYHAFAALVHTLGLPLLGHGGSLVLVRLATCLLGMGIVWLTYHAARHLVSRPTALLAAGVVAGVPMFVAMSAAINNETLAALAATGALAAIVAGIRHGFDRRRLATLAAWTAIGIGSKITSLGLLPAAGVALWWSGRRRGLSATVAVRQMLLIVAVAALATGWWFPRMAPLFDGTHEQMWAAVQPGYAQMAAERGVPAWYYIASVIKRGWMSFWGIFDAASRPLPVLVYAALAGVQAATGVGFLRLWRRGKLRGRRAAAAVVMALFATFVLAVFLQYNWKHFTPQGRYFFPLLLPFGLLTAAGWRALFPAHRRNLASALLLAGLLLLNLYALIVMPVRP